MAVQEFGYDEVISRANVNQRIKQIKNYFPVSVENGGTGATTPSGARSCLGVETRVRLYSNYSGTNSTITLSDDLGNYSCIDIDFNVGGEYFFVQRVNLLDISVSNGAETFLSANYRTAGAGTSFDIRWDFSKIKYKANTITWGEGGHMIRENGSILYSNKIPFKITNVYGYR